MSRIRVYDVCFAAVLSLLVFAASSASEAATCWRPTVSEAIKTTPIIFSGLVIYADTVDYPIFGSATLKPSPPHPVPRFVGSSRAVVLVNFTWKGVVPSFAVILAPHPTGANIGIRFGIGEFRTFFVYELDDRLMTDACAMMHSFVHPGERAARDSALDEYATMVAEHDHRIASAPHLVQPILDKARFLEDWNDFAGARNAYVTATKRRPGNVEAHLGLGRALFKLKRFREAKPPLDRAISLDPRNEEARALYRQVEFQTADPEIARLSGYRAIAVDSLDGVGAGLRGGDFSGSRLSAPNFTRANLSGANFSGAQLYRARMRETSLHGANLSRVHAFRIDLTRAGLTDANLAAADLQYVDLSGASLNGASGRGANLLLAVTNRASFSRADFSGATFRKSWNAGTDFSDANLDRADFRGADLSGANLSGASVVETRFEGARYNCRTRLPAGFNPAARQMLLTASSCLGRPVRQVFDGLHFQNVDFSGLDLRNASFRGATFSDSWFWEARLDGVDFSESQGASLFQGASLVGANFTGGRAMRGFVGYGPRAQVARRAPSLAGAKFSGATIDLRDFFDPARPGLGADLSKADLRGAVFDCARFTMDHVNAFQALAPWDRGAILGPDCARHVESR